jgi:hypothetical protein
MHNASHAILSTSSTPQARRPLHVPSHTATARAPNRAPASTKAATAVAARVRRIQPSPPPMTATPSAPHSCWSHPARRAPPAPVMFVRRPLAGRPCRHGVVAAERRLHAHVAAAASHVTAPSCASSGEPQIQLQPHDGHPICCSSRTLTDPFPSSSFGLLHQPELPHARHVARGPLPDGHGVATARAPPARPIVVRLTCDRTGARVHRRASPSSARLPTALSPQSPHLELQRLIGPSTRRLG